MFESEHELDDKVIEHDREEFVKKINAFYFEKKTTELLDGYAPFCKHIIMENFTRSKPHCIAVNRSNVKKLKTGYIKRAEHELPVLSRWFEKDSTLRARARFLDIILYSKEQIQLESKHTGVPDPHANIDYDYAIVGVKPQNEYEETPMQPITLMRNALGVEFGGSGISLNETLYNKAVDYWSRHAVVI
jgi:hypothetical protein